MKVKLLITIIAVFLTGLAFSQKVKVDITNKKIGGGRHDAFVTTIYNSNESDVKKEWKMLMKQYDPERVKSGGEIMADNARITSISTNTIDIYAAIDGAGDDVELVVGFDLGGAFVNGSHSGSSTAKSMVYDFAVKMTLAGIEELVKQEEKVLADKEKELEKLVKSNDRLHQNIDKYNNEIETAKSNIEKAEGDLVTNEKSQEDAKKLIDEQHKKVQQTADKLKAVK